MNRSLLAFIAVVSLETIFAAAAFAQSTPAAQPAQSTPAPASQSSPSVPAQRGQGTQAGQNSDKPDKKVWTNDDVGDLRDHSAISTVGKSNPKPANPSQKSVSPPSGKGAGWYRDQMQKLRAKIPPLDDKIRLLQAALNGQIVDSVRPYYGVKPDDWRDQLARLQKQREDIVAKISALEDQARRDGVPSYQLQ